MIVQRAPLITRLDVRFKRPLVRIYNAVFRCVPFALKYRLGARLRAYRPPYKYLRPGDTALFIGSARDILLAGRSRAMNSALIVGNSGRVIVFEADSASSAALRSYAARHGISQILVIGRGAWKARGKLHFLSDPDHPAANRLDGFLPAALDVADFSGVEIEVDTIDNMLRENGVTGQIRLVSVTTNGSELEVLTGLTETAQYSDFISVARAYRTTAVGRYLDALGFREVVIDDRGILYSRQAAT